MSERRLNVKARNPNQVKVTRSRRWFQQRRRPHDPMLVLNMATFNWESGWNRIFNRIPNHETVWC
jgi:hypothetical protein